MVLLALGQPAFWDADATNPVEIHVTRPRIFTGALDNLTTI